jgi:hypothetical protein
MSASKKIEVGSHVVTGAGGGKKGIVRFIGETEVCMKCTRFCNVQLMLN